MKNSFVKLLAAASIAATLFAQTPAPAPAGPPARGGAGGGGRGRGPQNQVPLQAHVDAMMAALPDKAPAKPKKPRHILVLAKSAGFVHSSIPLAAKTVEAMGNKTGAWKTTISYDPAVVTEENLKQYDAIFLASTTGNFLDDPNDEKVTEARRKAFLDFVRGGKGIAGIHAASDAYHGGGRGTPNVGTWPEFNKLIGGWFKYHWNDGQLITTKIDDPKSPLTKMFGGKDFEIRDETYTFIQDSFSRENVHVLTSINYDKMSPEDKAKEPAAEKRTDGDYALSYIRREGKGRVFYEAHGHNEKIYAIKPMLEHVLAGIQYALGDLKADDKPSVTPKKK
jgi:type 1 glutamine amidotransferase